MNEIQLNNADVNNERPQYYEFQYFQVFQHFLNIRQ